MYIARNESILLINTSKSIGVTMTNKLNEDIKHGFAVVGVGTTGTSSFVAFLPTVNIIVQILAGLTAIVVGFYTAKYYREKSIRRKLSQTEKDTDL